MQVVMEESKHQIFSRKVKGKGGNDEKVIFEF